MASFTIFAAVRATIAHDRSLNREYLQCHKISGSITANCIVINSVEVPSPYFLLSTKGCFYISIKQPQTTVMCEIDNADNVSLFFFMIILSIRPVSEMPCSNAIDMQ